MGASMTVPMVFPAMLARWNEYSAPHADRRRAERCRLAPSAEAGHP